MTYFSLVLITFCWNGVQPMIVIKSNRRLLCFASMDKIHSSQLYLMFKICYYQKDFKVIGATVEEYDIEVILT
jgi:hypothetical protein